MTEDIGAFVPGPRARIEGRPGGPLSGLTFAAKDLFDVAGVPTGGGNHDWPTGRPVPRCSGEGVLLKRKKTKVKTSRTGKP